MLLLAGVHAGAVAGVLPLLAAWQLLRRMPCLQLTRTAHPVPRSPAHHRQLFTTNLREYNRRVRRIAQKSVEC